MKLKKKCDDPGAEVVKMKQEINDLWATVAKLEEENLRLHQLLKGWEDSEWRSHFIGDDLLNRPVQVIPKLVDAFRRRR